METTDPFDSADFYSCDPSGEGYDSTNVGDAIGEYVDGMTDDAVAEHPAEVTVYAYKRDVIPHDTKMALAERTMQYMLEYLDDLYGGEGGTRASLAMRNEAQYFTLKFVDHYRVWQCSKVAEQNVDLREWLKENEPERLR